MKPSERRKIIIMRKDLLCMSCSLKWFWWLKQLENFIFRLLRERFTNGINVTSFEKLFFLHFPSIMLFEFLKIELFADRCFHVNPHDLASIWNNGIYLWINIIGWNWKSNKNSRKVVGENLPTTRKSRRTYWMTNCLNKKVFFFSFDRYFFFTKVHQKKK